MTAVPRPVPPGLAGKLVTPGDRRYGALRSTYTRAGSPALVALPESPSDVASALALAADQRLRVSVRSGGHGLSGAATNDGGLVIDLSAMRGVRVLDRGARLVRVEAGARWAEVARALAPHGLAISSGDHGNVGVGGLATGGGIGWLVRSYGLTIDHVRAVEVVLADGSLVRADAEHEPDLLWAMRGAGSGTAIATAFEIEAVELGMIGYAEATVVVDSAGTALRRWAALMAAAPRELSTAVNLSGQGSFAVASVTAIVASDSESVIRGALEPLAGLGDTVLHQAYVLPYPQLLSTAQLHGHNGQMPVVTTNGLLTRMTPEAARSLVAAVTAPEPVLVQMRSLGGAVNDMDPAATAYPHRHQRTLVTATAFPPGDGETLSAAWKPLLPRTDGAYVNFESRPDEETFARAYPGGTGARVTELRRRYDPDGVLRPRAL
ncbi:FAD-binding oxidoreductase [Streptomyces sp. NPDC088354]|uniref:FAD-binding oxidoreductase n=1 Tax=unclassified Streptomyces TaxID=2593676 RepID=UPI0029BA6F6F|nr:FAD-binding oxidoreductase [Streptomyces sp. MI02-7b]MDX3070899.1 FAD-binding oxidoreductase [Streptomyces sp. MI02-7b]